MKTHTPSLRFLSKFLAISVVFYLIFRVDSTPAQLSQGEAKKRGSMTRNLQLGPEYQNIAQISHLIVDLRYGSNNNFVGENLYGDLKTAYLHMLAFDKLKVAADLLQRQNPGWKLLVFDALRPRSVQRKLFNKVKGTPQESYVANPDIGSIHNYGFAIDLTLADQRGREVDMGTGYDDFRRLSEPRHEDKYLKSGALTQAQLNHRLLLRTVMLKAGFRMIQNEWWHFDALSPALVRARYTIIE